MIRMMGTPLHAPLNPSRGVFSPAVGTSGRGERECRDLKSAVVDLTQKAESDAATIEMLTRQLSEIKNESASVAKPIQFTDTERVAKKKQAQLMHGKVRRSQLDELDRLRTENVQLRADAEQRGARSAKMRASSKGIKTTRSKFRQVLDDRIGPCPEHDWRDEFDHAMQEGMRQVGLEFDNYPFRRSFEAFAEHHSTKSGMMEKVTAVGFSLADAELIVTSFCTPMAYEIRDALENGSNKYAAMTHAICHLITNKVSLKRSVAGTKESRWHLLAAGIKGATLHQTRVAPKCYWHLRGPGGLLSADSRWGSILDNDSTGYRGFTSYAPLFFQNASNDSYSAEGLKAWDAAEQKTTVMDSPIVCFSSTSRSSSGVLQTAVKVMQKSAEEDYYMLPPLTLLTVIDVTAGPFEYLPGKFINQKLITVRPCFMKARVKSNAQEDEARKLATNQSFLHYGTLHDGVRGLEDIADDCVMSMEEEFMRDDKWYSWKGKTHSAQEEWRYVQGLAGQGLEDVDVQLGRDKGRLGWSLKRFKEQLEDYILTKIGLREHSSAAVAVDSDQTRRHKEELSESLMLSMDEVIAIRLYTGPAFQPINNFLREISKVGVEWRRRLAKYEALTYAATVQNLANGLRKLVRVKEISKDAARLRKLVRIWRTESGDHDLSVEVSMYRTSRCCCSMYHSI
jgi:hypothetical protein